jgi:NMD protein affecting ribosome stability and mRNA decay
MLFVLCKSCGKDKEIRAKGLCLSCYYKEYRKIKAFKGLCIECGKYKIAKNKSAYYCGKCLAKKRYNQQFYRDKKTVGIE